MKPPKGEYVPPPSPELLAAYADGEFEGQEHLSARKRSIEDWLRQHPEAAADILAWRRLKQLWQDTAAEEPAEATWDKLWCRLEPALNQPLKPGVARPTGFPWQRGIAAAVVLLAVSVSGLLASRHLGDFSFWSVRDQAAQSTPGQEMDGNKILAQAELVEPFPVATEDEVNILHVEGADTGTLVTGRLPVVGPLVLAQHGDVLVSNFEPAPTDNMFPDLHMGEGVPMIYARVEREMIEP